MIATFERSREIFRRMVDKNDNECHDGYMLTEMYATISCCLYLFLPRVIQKATRLNKRMFRILTVLRQSMNLFLYTLSLSEQSLYEKKGDSSQ